MTGKLLAIILVTCAVAAGAGMYYLQVYGFYYDVEPRPGQDVALLSAATGVPEPIAYDAFRAIDADSSPIRFRACFETTVTPDQLAASFVPAQTRNP